MLNMVHRLHELIGTYRLHWQCAHCVRTLRLGNISARHLLLRWQIKTRLSKEYVHRLLGIRGMLRSARFVCGRVYHSW